MKRQVGYPEHTSKICPAFWPFLAFLRANGLVHFGQFSKLESVEGIDVCRPPGCCAGLLVSIAIAVTVCSSGECVNSSLVLYPYHMMRCVYEMLANLNTLI